MLSARCPSLREPTVKVRLSKAPQVLDSLDLYYLSFLTPRELTWGLEKPREPKAIKNPPQKEWQEHSRHRSSNDMRRRDIDSHVTENDPGTRGQMMCARKISRFRSPMNENQRTYLPKHPKQTRQCEDQHNPCT